MTSALGTYSRIILHQFFPVLHHLWLFLPFRHKNLRNILGVLGRGKGPGPYDQAGLALCPWKAVRMGLETELY